MQCANCASQDELLCCSACHVVCYCDAICQRGHYKLHKLVCQELETNPFLYWVNKYPTKWRETLGMLKLFDGTALPKYILVQEAMVYKPTTELVTTWSFYHQNESKTAFQVLGKQVDNLKWNHCQPEERQFGVIVQSLHPTNQLAICVFNNWKEILTVQTPVKIMNIQKAKKEEIQQKKEENKV
jgi:hypothetical protein